jgi:hypothetical protein
MKKEKQLLNRKEVEENEIAAAKTQQAGEAVQKIGKVIYC